MAFPEPVQREMGYALYVAQMGERVYVLHAFQKKSKKEITTPKADVKLIERRLKELVEERKRNQ
jgi:phage-related protein